MPLNLENEDANVNSTDLKKKPTKKTKEMLEENTRQIEELTASQSELDSELAALLPLKKRNRLLARNLPLR